MINKVILVGRLGKDPEIRHLEGNVAVANFSIATTESYKNKSGEKVENTEWHNIVLWRGLAEVAEKYLRKGDLIYVEGRIRTRSWEDKDGNKRYTTEIQGDSMTMLGQKKSSSEMASSATQNTEEPKISDELSSAAEDDLPF